MKSIIMLVLVSMLGFFVACSGEKQEQSQTEETQMMESHEGHDMQGEMATDMVTDPVCGMKIKKEDAVATVEHNNKTYYFCNQADKEAFEKNPKKYVENQMQDSKMDM